MKIIITMAQSLFVSGGAEHHALNLKTALLSAGHEAEIVNIPMHDDPVTGLEDQILAMRLFNIEHTFTGDSDLCIGLKFPSYYIRHPNKVIWLLHQFRPAYDLWQSDISNMHLQPGGHRMKEIITNADNLYLKEAKSIFANSGNVAGRLKKFNQIDSTPLYHPCPDMESFYCGNYSNYILMPSRINLTKRQMLAVEAMVYTKSDIHLYIVGKADNPDVLKKIKQFVNERGLEKRIRFFDFVVHEEKLELYAHARAVMFIPYDEDYGYITLEAMSASKTVITATDSGGPLEFVEHDKTGLVVPPDPVELAKAIDEVARSKSYAEKLGAEAKKHLTDMNITWDNVVKELTR